MHVEGLGDVCSLATFDLARHGNPRYGSPLSCPKVRCLPKLHLSCATPYQRCPACPPQGPLKPPNLRSFLCNTKTGRTSSFCPHMPWLPERQLLHANTRLAALGSYVKGRTCRP